MNKEPLEQHSATADVMKCRCVEDGFPDRDKTVSCTQCGFRHHYKCVGITEERDTLRWSCHECLLVKSTGAYPKIRSNGQNITDVHEQKLHSEQGTPKRPSIPPVQRSMSQRDVRLTHILPPPTEIVQTEEFQLTESILNARPTSNSNSSISTSEIRRQLEMQRIDVEKEMAEKLMNERMQASNNLWENRMKEQEAIFKEREDANRKYLDHKFRLLQSSAGTQKGSSVHSLRSNWSNNNSKVNTERWVSQINSQSGLSENNCGANDISKAVRRTPFPAPTKSNIQRNASTNYDSDHSPNRSVQHAVLPKTRSGRQEPIPMIQYPSSTLCETQSRPAAAENISQNQFVARQVIKTELPTFNGKPEEWAHFICAYDGSTESCGLSNAENLSRLQRCLKGRAYEAVRYLLLSPNTVSEAIETLRALYGRPEVIIHTLMSDILKLPAPKADKFDTVVDFALSVRNLTTMMKVTNLNDYLKNNILLHELVDKLPTHIRISWAQQAGILQEVNLLTFSNWLFHFAMSLHNVTMPHLDLGKSKQVNKHTVNTHREADNNKSETKSKNSNPDIKKSKPNCVVCSKNIHKVADCKVFQNMNMEERWAKLIELKLCRKCLGSHYYLQCRVKDVCGVNGCEARHHPLFHRDKIHPNTQDLNEASALNTHQGPKKPVLYRIIPIKLFGRGNVVVNTFAFLDDGSSLTMIEENLADELNLNGKSEDLCLRWTKKTSRVEKNSKRVAMEISGPSEGAYKYNISNVRTVQSLDLPMQSISTEVLERYRHTHNLPISTYEQAVPRILIGIDNSKLVCPLKSKDGDWDEPVATKTRLGWTLHGVNSGTESNEKEEHVHMNLHVCECERDDVIHQLVKDHFAIESLGVTKPTNMPESAKEKREKEIMQATTRMISNRYETGLIWKQDQTIMPDSYPMALKRLQCLERKLAADPAHRKKIQECIDDYVQKNYARKLNQDEATERHPKTWYLPIFTVKNPNKPDKFRVVWDAAARVKGVSLNSMLLSGPDQMISLLGVLLRFREGRVGITGDITEMFHQVRIIPSDQEAQRFLWRDDPNKNPDHYVLQVMSFGATCSPSLAQFAINTNAREFQDTHPRAVESIIQNHYVDDMLESTDTEAEGVQLIQEVTMIHKNAGFDIRKWQSNSKYVRDSISDAAVERQKNLELDSNVDVEKVLGMWWCTTSDTFRFSLKYTRSRDILQEEKRPTKRDVLKIVMSIFDPMGLISFYVIYARIILRDMWRSSLDWDDDISDPLFERWLTWTRLLPKIEEINIPRCYSPHTPNHDVKSRELHVFVDASEDAYAAVAYIRIETIYNQVHCSLIGSKARVVPQQPLTIPRAELQAATIGARLAQTICNEQRISFHRRIMWSDSRTVLCWLNADCRKFKPFVAFRVGEILENTDLKEWRWVPTRANVADDATKWQHQTPNFDETCRWFKAPEFLYQAEEHWPQTNKILNTTNEELRPNHVLVCIEHEHCLDPSKFSSWTRLLRTCAYILRFVYNVQCKKRGVNMQKGSLNKEELLLAERFLFRQAQSDVYAEEITALSQNPPKAIWKQSQLYKNSPYVDEYGVLRMRGRINRATEIPVNARRPILLPRTHPITRLVITSYHTKYHHMNHETVVNEMRQRFDIPRLRVEVKVVSRNCQSCKNAAAKPIVPQMADLPAARCTPFVRAFSYVGVDYFGPMYVVVGRRREKRYGVLFTCLTVRAIHLEIAHSLSTDSCIMAIRNFEARRGHPIEYFSDNGTNFHGTNNLLRDEWIKMNKSKIEESITNPETKWTFNPPSAPHMGGIWERLVRSVKTILGKSMPTRNPSDELLRSFLMEVESIINSRPLTYMPVESSEDESLTPNHFILGSSSGVKALGQFNGIDQLISRSGWRVSQELAHGFWKRWVREYLPTITRRTKWFDPVEPIQVGDIVIVADENNPMNTWPKGIVLQTTVGSNGQVRKAKVKTPNGEYTRPVAKLAKLDLMG